MQQAHNLGIRVEGLGTSSGSLHEYGEAEDAFNQPASCLRPGYLLVPDYVGGVGSAAYEFYVTIEGTKQGAFQGEGVGRDRGRIPCLQFSYQSNASRDVAAGQASGKRQHGQTVIVKERGAASPQIFRAVTTNEVLKQVSPVFVRATPDGREEVYKTLRITNAVAASVRMLANPRDPRVLEEVTLIFEQGNLEAKGSDTKPLPVEHWMGIQK